MQKVTAPPSTKESPVEAEYTTRTITSRAADTTTEIAIPAKTGTYSTTVLKTSASTKEVPVDAEFRTVSKRNLVSVGGRSGWVEVLCEKDINYNKIREVQQALKDKGYDVGAVDGIMGGGTKAAIRKFQEDNGLPIGGSLNIELLKALGVY